MVSLNDLRSAAVSLDWHEAVAAGAALAALLAEGQVPACPHPADVAVLPSGDLHVSGPEHLAAAPAAGVALVLSQLLEAAPCPAELRQQVESYAADARTGAAGIAAVAELLSVLAFYERPGRRDVLAAVALRAAAVLERAHRSAALEALTERTRQAGRLAVAQAAPAPDQEPPDVAETPDGRDPPDESGIRRMLVPVAVGLAAFLAMAYVAAAWLDRPSPPRAHPAAAEEDLPISRPERSAAAGPGVAPQGRRTPAPPRTGPLDSEPGSPKTPAVSVVSRGDCPPATPAAIAPPPGTPVATPPSPRTVDVVVAERDGGVVPSTIAPARSTPRVVESGRVFQSGDPQVTPAVLIKPLLPASPPPDVPEEQIGTLEVVVAESGAVEHVHLVSPANRYQERMLVAAAKSWQFRPATRDGRPVRFRTRIRVTL